MLINGFKQHRLPSGGQVGQDRLWGIFRQVWGSCSVLNPLQVVGHSGINPIVAWSGTALSPADNAQQEDGLLVLCHQGSAAVAFTRVRPPVQVSGTEHVLGECDSALLHAGLSSYSRHLGAPEEDRGGPVLAPPAPATHSVPLHPPQLTLSQRSCWQADRDDIRGVDYRRG